MKVVTRIDIAREIAERAREWPGPADGWVKWVRRLKAVEPDQITPEIVDAACGWNRTGLTCDECSASVESVVEFREECDTAQVCKVCLLAALTSLNGAMP